MTSATMSACLDGISAISIHPVTGPIIVAHHNSTSSLELGCLSLYGPTRSTHSLSYGSALASLPCRWPYLELWVLFVVWHVTHSEHFQPVFSTFTSQLEYEAKSTTQFKLHRLILWSLLYYFLYLYFELVEWFELRVKKSILRQVFPAGVVSNISAMSNVTENLSSWI